MLVVLFYKAFLLKQFINFNHTNQGLSVVKKYSPLFISKYDWKFSVVVKHSNWAFLVHIFVWPAIPGSVPCTHRKGSNCTCLLHEESVGVHFLPQFPYLVGSSHLFYSL